MAICEEKRAVNLNTEELRLMRGKETELNQVPDDGKSYLNKAPRQREVKGLP